MVNIQYLDKSQKVLKFFKNLKTINSINSGINKTNHISSSSLNEDSEHNVINQTQNNLDNTSTIYNRIPDLNEMTFKPINYTKKLNLAELDDVDSKLILNSNSQSKSNSKSSFEFSIKKRYKVEKSLNNLSYDLTEIHSEKEKQNLEFFARPKAKTDKVTNIENFKKILAPLHTSSTLSAENPDSNYDNSDEETQNIYLRKKMNIAQEPEELIGIEIKEKVKDILGCIVKNYPANVVDEESENESYKHKSIFTIFNHRPSKRLITLKRKKIGDEILLINDINEKFRLRRNSKSKPSREKIKHNTMSKVLPRLSLNYINENYNSEFFSNITPLENHMEIKKIQNRGNPQSWDSSSGQNIKSLLQMKITEVDSKRDDKISKILKASNAFIEKNYVNFHLEKQSRNNRLIKFYKHGFSKFMMNIIEKDKNKDNDNYKDQSENLKFQNISLKSNPFMFSRKFNDFLFDKYFDLFKELLIEVLNQENNFYELDTEGNKIGKSIYENFKIKQDLTKFSKRRIQSEFEFLVKRCNTGQGIMKHFGIRNHVFVNNFVIRDCFHDFKENNSELGVRNTTKDAEFSLMINGDEILESRKKFKSFDEKVDGNNTLKISNKKESSNNFKNILNQDENHKTLLDKVKEKGLKLPRRNKQFSSKQLQKLEMLTKFSILNNKSIFSRVNKK